MMKSCCYDKCVYCGEDLYPAAGPFGMSEHQCDGTIRARAEHIQSLKPSVELTVKVSSSFMQRIEEVAEEAGEDVDVIARLALVQGLVKVEDIYNPSPDYANPYKQSMRRMMGKKI